MVVSSARLFPSSRGALSLVGFFATIILYLVRINMSIAIVCMTIDEEDAGEAVNATLNVTAYQAHSYDVTGQYTDWSPSILAYDTDVSKQPVLDVSNDAETCPGEAEPDEHYEEVNFVYNYYVLNVVNDSKSARILLLTCTYMHIYLQTGEFYWDRDLRGTINSSFFWGYVLTQVVGGMLAMKFGAKWVLGGGLTISIVCTFLSPAAARISPYALMAARFFNGVGSVCH